MSGDLSALQRKLNDTHILIQLQVRMGDSSAQRSLLVKRDMKVRELLDEIARELLRGSTEKRADYKLYRGDEVLPPRATFERDRSPLVLTFRRQRGDVQLVDEETKRTFQIEELPAVVGRRSDEERRGEYKVNLDEFGDTLINISRRHARLSMDGGRYYVTNISKGNFLYVDNDKVDEDATREIQPGAVLTLASRKFRFEQKGRR